MKRTGAVLALIVAGVAGAQRVDEFDAEKVAPRDRMALLGELPDGGCALVEVCARLISTDAGAELRTCRQPRLELRRPADRNLCLNVLDKAGAWWENAESVSRRDAGL